MNKKIAAIAVVCVLIALANTYAQVRGHADEPPKNLKVLPPNISGDELHKIMRTYAISLGVHCNFCHAAQQGSDKPRMDFASDEKPEKDIARSMIRMVDSINHMIDGIGNNKLEHITCVTCHNGNIKPLVSADSLVKKDYQ